jgi:hypothetical protein
MTKKLQRTISAATLRLLYPLVRILLRNGIAYGSFAELVKKTFVDVAFHEHTPVGKKQTISRVSAITGLTRKEVKRLLELRSPDDSANQERFNRGVRVISGWVNDARFHNDAGKPADLSLEGDRSSFAMLVKEYSGDIPTKAMLAMLEEAGSVRRVKDKVRLVRQAFVSGSDPIEKIHILGTDVSELITTINHNLTADQDDLWFQRKVAYDNVDAAAVARLKELSFKKAQALLEQMDRQYASHELPDSDDGDGRYISLGIYYYEQDSSQE